MLNVRHQRQCTIEDDAQQCSILLVFCVVEWLNRQFQFQDSGPALLLFISSAECFLEYEVRRLVDTPPFSFPTSREVIVEKMFHVIVVMRWRTVLLTNSLRPKQVADGRHSVV